MGSWVELDAYYPPGTLTPAAALVVALGHLAGAASAYGADGALACFWPRGPRGVAPDQDLVVRVEHFLSAVPFDDFLAEANQRLNPGQRRALLLNVLDAALARSPHPADLPHFTQLVAGLGAAPDWLPRAQELLEYKNDLSVFPQ